MSLLRTLKVLMFKAKTEVETGLKDIEAEGLYTIIEAQDKIKKFQEAICKIKVDSNILIKQKQEVEDQIKKFNEVKKSAERKGETSDMNEADNIINIKNILLRKLEVEISKNKKVSDDLDLNFERAKLLVESSKSNYTRLCARNKSAQIRKEIAKANSQLQDDSSFEGLREFEKRVNELEAEAETYEQMSSENNTKEELLIQKYQ